MNDEPDDPVPPRDCVGEVVSQQPALPAPLANKDEGSDEPRPERNASGFTKALYYWVLSRL